MPPKKFLIFADKNGKIPFPGYDELVSKLQRAQDEGIFIIFIFISLTFLEEKEEEGEYSREVQYSPTSPYYSHDSDYTPPVSSQSSDESEEEEEEEESGAVSPMSLEQMDFLARHGKTLYPDANEIANKLKRVHDEGNFYLYSFFSSFPFLTLYLEDDDSVKKSRISQSKEEIPNTFGALFFHDVPFDINSEKDAFLLDPDNDDDEPNAFSIKMHNQRNIFARNIRAYDYGISIRKHCAPWGDNAILTSVSFAITKKTYNVYGNLALVNIKETMSPYREFVLKPAFFNGWLNTDYVV